MAARTISARSYNGAADGWVAQYLVAMKKQVLNFKPLPRLDQVSHHSPKQILGSQASWRIMR